MVVFRTRKPDISPNDSRDSSGDGSLVKTSIAGSLSPHPVVPNARVLSPIQAHGLKQYSFRSDFNPHSPLPLLRPSSSSSNQSHRIQSPQPHPPCYNQSFTPRYTPGYPSQAPLQRASPIQSSPYQPQQHQLTSRSRQLSFMGAQDQPLPQSTASSAALTQSSFRLLKSKIFSSTSKFKPSPQPGLTPSSSTGAPYLSPSIAASSDHLNNSSQTAHHETNTLGNSAAQQKFNTISHGTRSNGPIPPPTKEEQVDWVHLDPSGLAITPRPSNDFPRPTSIHAGYSSSPANRILIDSNANRRNYPQFNNKPPIQAGPRVMRINPQSENLKRLNTPPSGNPPTNDLSFYAQSLRPTPVPHGGSRALLSINTSHSNRPDATNQLLQQANMPPFAPASLEPFSTSLVAEPTHDRERPILNRLGSKETDIINVPQRHSSFQLEQPLKAAASSRIGPTSSSHIAPIPPQSSTPSTESNSLSSSPTQHDGSTPELSHEAGHTYKTTLTYLQKAAPTVDLGFTSVTAASSTMVSDISKPMIESQAVGPPLKIASSTPPGSLDLGDFSYLFHNSNALAKRTDTIDFKHLDSTLSKPKAIVRSIPPPLAFVSSTESSTLTFPPLKSPLSPHETLGSSSPTLLVSARSDNYSSKLPSIESSQCSPKSVRNSKSPSSLQSTPVKPERLASSSSSFHITNSSTPQSPLPLLPSAPSPLSANNSSISTGDENFPSHLPSFQKSIVPDPEPSSINIQSELELEQARQLILGLQKQVKLLKDASIKPLPVTEGNTPDSPLVIVSPATVTLTYDDVNVQKSLTSASIPNELDNCPKDSVKTDTSHQPGVEIRPSDTTIKSHSPSFVVVPDRNPIEVPNPQYAFPTQCVTTTDSQSNDHDEQQAARSVSQLIPSRLPVAQHRLRAMASLDFEKTLISNTDNTMSLPRRQMKASLTSSVSTEYRYDTPESYSTQMTTPSPISTTHRFNRAPSAKQASLSDRVRADTDTGPNARLGKQTSLSERVRADTGASSQASGWARERQNSVHNNYPEKGSKFTRSTILAGGQEPRWLPARPLNDSATLAALTRSSSSLSQTRVRPDPANSRHQRQHQPSPSISLQSVHDEEFSESGSELDSLFERTSHSSSHQASRSGLDSVNEDSALHLASGKFNKFSLRLMTKPELLTIIKKQRAKLENIKEAFVAERDDLLETLEHTREKEAELSRERERLMAEDAWKTDELNRAREEIGWLSRLADTLELEKSRLETRANSMANELKRAVVDLRTVSTASSQGLGSSRDLRAQPVASCQTHAPLRPPGADDYPVRKSDSSSQSRSIRKSSYSHASISSTPHRVRQESVESNSTVCRLVTSPQLQASKSQSNLKSIASSLRGRDPQLAESMSNPRAREFNIPQRKSPAQRSVPDFRSPLSPLKLSSQRPGRHERLSSRHINSRRPNGSRSISSGQSHTEDQDEEIDSEDELRDDVIMEEEREERSSRDAHWAHRDAERRHSRSSSSSSQAISPSSTVFADHHRDHSSRTAARSSGSQDQHSNVYRSSLISLQLRPEDELFLENYLEEDGDGIDTDMDY